MHLVIDENLPYAKEFFAPNAHITRLPGSAITAATVKDADALLVRSVTQVNQALLAASQVQFVGTATIGIDHLDTAWLNAAQIPYTNAPGCNANSVVDYVIAVLLHLASERNLQLQELTVGIVGVGQVGGRLAQRLSAYGCKLVLNDPPRAVQEPGFVSLAELLESADVICLHTPLTRSGDFPTQKLLGAKQLQAVTGKILINAGRGEVIDQTALKEHLRLSRTTTCILDVFADEPYLDLDLIQHCYLATPHIAGYSLEGKARGTEQIYQAWCKHFGLQPQVNLAALLPQPPWQQLNLTASSSPQEACQLAADLCYQPLKDAWRLLKNLTNNPTGAQVYHQLRKHYPLRREFATVPVQAATPQQASALKALGFTLV